MPRLRTPTKDVASCDKLRSAARQALTAEDLRMGKPLEGYASRLTQVRGILGELKHLINPGKEINTEIPKVVASEMGTAQTGNLLPGL